MAAGCWLLAAGCCFPKSMFGVDAGIIVIVFPGYVSWTLRWPELNLTFLPRLHLKVYPNPRSILHLFDRVVLKLILYILPPKIVNSTVITRYCQDILFYIL